MNRCSHLLPPAREASADLLYGVAGRMERPSMRSGSVRLGYAGTRDRGVVLRRTRLNETDGLLEVHARTTTERRFVGAGEGQGFDDVDGASCDA